jgi:VirE N-terminal domain/DnaB-like helicase C terminal domain
MITVFKDVYDLTPKYTPIERVLNGIKTCAVQKTIDAIQDSVKAGKSKKEIDALKYKLPSILFSGEFKSRSNESQTLHSGYVILDFDYVENAIEKRDSLKEYPFIYSAFVSPSGRGVKALAKIPPIIADHRAHYNALQLVFPELDGTSINEARVCFMCADSGIWVNEDAIEFTDKVEVKAKPVLTGSTEHIASGTNYRKIAIAAEMVQKSGIAADNKHATLLKAATLMGGYIAGGIVEESEAVRVLETEISKKDIEDFPAAQKTIRKGIEYGKTLPIFEIEKMCSNQPKVEGIQSIDEVWESMKYTFKHGKKRGETTHFEQFDARFTWKAGEITLIIARPNFGKTEFGMQLMLMKSVFCGWKWAVFSPENYPADEFYDSIIHSYIGKTTDPYFHYQMSMEEYERGYKFVREHFFYVYPEVHTMEEVDANFVHLINEKKIQGCFIDPYNQLEMEYGAREDLFLSKFLRDRKRFAIDYNLHYIISTHPKSMSRDKNGNYPIPEFYDIAGGAMWGNKADNIMVLDRPNYFQNPQDTQVDVHVKKIKKQKLVGTPGMQSFTFERKSNRYYIDGISPLSNEIINTMPIKEYGTTPIKPRQYDIKDITESNKEEPLLMDDGSEVPF